MPTVLAGVPDNALPFALPRKRWTRADCAPLEAAGMFEREHLELVNGELISKMGKNRPHVHSLTMMLVWLQEVFGRTFVNPEAPIDVSPEDNERNEPEPDVVVLNRESGTFRGNPQPHDLKLVVEISDSTLGFDLSIKADLYARAGIIEYWVVDVSGHRLIVHRTPAAGKYSSVIVYGENETVAPLTAPNAEFQFARVLGPTNV
jgi:Uma2 family endonuclease